MAVRKGTFRNVVNSKTSGENYRSKRRGFQLADIKDRPHGDTRPLNSQHVEELAESIAVVGLIQPLAVDSEGYLLAGAHRRAAIQIIEQTQPDKFTELFSTGVPVRVFEFSAVEDPEQAISIEAAENEKRRDYTPNEVRGLADKLLQAGYVDQPGRVKSGTKRLKPALALIIGKSQKTVQRYLNSSNSIRTDVQVGKWDKRADQLERWAKDTEDKNLAQRAIKMAKDFRAISSAL